MNIFKSIITLGLVLIASSVALAQVNVGGVTVTNSQTAPICTADAKLCADGSYVGRSGPSCAFICPDDGDIPPVTSNECVDLKNNMFTRSRDSQTNGEVSELQDFLSPEYFDQDPTGFFGRRTLAGVKSFQRDNGLRAFGYVGPATRAKIKQLTCSGTSKTIQIKSLSPSVGLVGTEVVISGDGINVGGDQIYFGGSLVTASVSSNADTVNVLRFKVPGSITPCGVGGQNLCKISSRPVTTGSYEVAVVNSRGTSNTLSFTVTSSTTNPPIISGVSGPQTLNVNQQGTWTVTASNPSGGNISYSVVWGDEATAGTGSQTFSTQTPQQTATFTRAYSRAGLFTPRFTVTNVNGQSATASLSVNVGNMIIQSPLITKFQVENVETANSVSLKLVWTTQFTSSCTASNAWSGIQAVNGSYTIGFMSQPLTYILTCINSQGASVSRSVTHPISGTTQTPSISSLSPASGSVGTRVTILGTNINTNEEVVTFGGSLNYVDIVQPRQQGRVEFIIPSDIGASCPRFITNPICPPGAFIQIAPGTYEVAVANRNGTSNRLSFTVTAANANVPIPTITSFTPTTVVAGANANIVITGINFGIETFNILRFMNMQGVQVGNASFANASSPTSVTFPFHSDIIPGTYRLQARVPGNGNNWSPSSDQILTVTASTQTANSPTISSLSQNSGGTGVAVIVYGSDIGFTDTVNFGTITIVPDQTYKVANQIRFIIPTTLNACTGICPDLFQPTPLGGYSVSVTNPKGIKTNALQYTVTSNGSASTF